MLSSVSYVCLGVCAGMWVITRGIYLGVLCWFCLSSRSCCSSVRVIVCFFTFQCVCVFFLFIFCRCFQLYYVVVSSGCGSPGIQCFTIPCKFSSGCCVGQQNTQYFRQVFLRLLMTEAKTASPLESAVHSIAWFYQLDGEPSPSAHPLEYSWRCAEFAGPSNNQDGTYHRLSVRAVSCLQGGLNGLFV